MQAFITRVVFELNGFNPFVVNRLGLKDQFTLISLSLWGLVGTVLSAYSVAYIVHYATDSITFSILSFLICFFVLISLHVLLVTSSSMELNIKPNKRSDWRPSKFRPLTYFMVGLLFSQPIVLTGLSVTDTLESNVSIQNLDTQIESVKNRYKAYSDLKNLKLIQLQTYRNIADQNAPNVTIKYFKKAILIDNAGDVSDSFKLLEDKLNSLGFKITTISNTFGADLDLKIRSYYDSINTGDISLLIYRGPSKITSDHSLELTQKKQGLFAHSVDVDSLISIISNKKPLASYFLFSLSPEGNNSENIESIDWENYENTHIASLSNDTDGELIRALEKKLEDPIELNGIFQSVEEELVQTKRADSKLSQTPNLKFPIFLSWSQGSFYKELNKSEMEGLLPSSDYCKTYSSLEQSSFSKCLEAEENIVNAEIRFINEMRGKNVQSIEVVKARKLKAPSIVMNYTGWVTKHLFLTFSLSLIAMFIVTGAYIIRDYSSIGAIVKYESKGVQMSRIGLHQQFRAYRTVIKRIRKRFSKEGEKFDNIELQHPLYRTHLKERKQKPDSSGDDLYKTLIEAIKIKKRSSL
jgi:hypothetical protein